MSFKFNCPYCDKKLEAEDNWDGLESQCSFCSKSIIIPQKPKIILKPLESDIAESSDGSSKFNNATAGKNKSVLIEDNLTPFCAKHINSRWKRVCSVIIIFFVVFGFPFILTLENGKECYDKGMKFYNEENFGEAAVWLEKSVQAGYSEAQTFLGYENKEQYEISTATIESLLKRKKAQEWYEKGKKNYEEDKLRDAEVLLEKSAAAGNPTALSLLILLRNKKQEWYDKGMECYKYRNFREAAFWLEKSADAGYPGAQKMLDYENGRKPDTSHISFEVTLQWKANYERGF